MHKNPNISVIYNYDNLIYSTFFNLENSRNNLLDNENIIFTTYEFVVQYINIRVHFFLFLFYLIVHKNNKPQ